MVRIHFSSPNKEAALMIAKDVIGSPVTGIERFTTGKDHYVYDVETGAGKFVVRMNNLERAETFRSALYWYEILKEKEIPLANVLFSDTTGERFGLPVIVMERIPGVDLNQVYGDLNTIQKEQLAREMVSLQNRVGELDRASGFGYATSHEDPRLYKSWGEVIDATLIQRIIHRNKTTGLLQPVIISRMEELRNAFQAYFASVAPNPFLDDTTTKNVLIHNGALSGIVDIDYVCFGDPLLVLALTQMSLIEMQVDTDYTDYWSALLDLTREQKRVVNFYSSLFALEFASAMGHTFNQDHPETIHREDLGRLVSAFAALSQDLL